MTILDHSHEEHSAPKSTRTAEHNASPATGSTAPGSTQRPNAPKSPASNLLDRFFQITERGSTLAREFRGGLVTFFTMAYIVILNPLILGGFAADNAPTDVAGGWLSAAQV